MKHERVFSGLQPTGRLHIGNYFGAVRQWIALQDGYDCIYCIVDYHALTTPQDPGTFAQATLDAAIDYLALGLDPRKSTIFVQSHVPEHTELAWIFNTLTPLTELARMTQFKEKAETHQKVVNAGLYTYPTLMAADILLYEGTLVPVGEDQVQHVELTRKIARWFNNRYGKTLPEPKPKLGKSMRIMSLNDPTRKMSKSHGEKAYVALSDNPNTIRRKLQRAVTATLGGNVKDPGVENLFTLLREVSADATVRDFEAAQADGSIKYAELKAQLATDLIDHLAVYRQRRKELAGKPNEVKAILENGRARASVIAKETMGKIREKIGLLR